MVVTTKTRWSDFEKTDALVTDKTRAEIQSTAEATIRPYGELTIDEFWGLMSGNYDILGDMDEPTVLQVYWMRGFEKFCKSMTETLDALKVPTDPNKDKIYQRGCVELTPQEHMLIFVRGYFGLHSFYAAGRRTIGEYITARKDEYNRAMAQYNFEQMQAEKMKKKR